MSWTIQKPDGANGIFSSWMFSRRFILEKIFEIDTCFFSNIRNVLDLFDIRKNVLKSSKI